MVISLVIRQALKTGKCFGITKFVSLKKTNTLALKVSTQNRGYGFDINNCLALSVIYRAISLIAVPKTHIKDVVVKTYVKNNHNTKLDLSVVCGKLFFVLLLFMGDSIFPQFSNITGTPFIKNFAVRSRNWRYI